MEHSVQAYIQRLDTAALEDFLERYAEDQNREIRRCILEELQKRVDRGRDAERQ